MYHTNIRKIQVKPILALESSIQFDTGAMLYMDQCMIEPHSLIRVFAGYKMNLLFLKNFKLYCISFHCTHFIFTLRKNSTKRRA